MMSRRLLSVVFFCFCALAEVLNAQTSGTATITINGSSSSKYVNTCPTNPNGTCWTTIPNQGTVSIKINGTSYQVNYAQWSTATTVASDLTGQINNGTLATATASANTVTVVARATGTSSNYSLSTSCTYYTTYFSSCDFTGTAPSALSGGSNGPVTPSLSLSSSNMSTTYGTSVIFTATITNGATGTISFRDGGTAIGTGTISGSNATYSTPSLGAGTHTITAYYGGNGSYGSATSSAISQTVAKKALTVAANNVTRAYGAANPALTASYTGFANGETTSVLTGTPSLTTAATTSSALGDYPITISAGTLSSNNYSFAFVNGTLTVSKIAPTVTWNTPSAIGYGTALSTAQLNASLSVPGTCTYSPSAGTFLPAGQQQLSVTCTPTDGATYSVASSSVTISVNGPTISTIVPSSGPPDSLITISGANFGSTQDSSTISLNGLTTVVVSWSAKSIVAWVPDNAPANTLVPLVIAVQGTLPAAQVTGSFSVTGTSGSSGSCSLTQ